jgi:hypothetical protein
MVGATEGSRGVSRPHGGACLAIGLLDRRASRQCHTKLFDDLPINPAEVSVAPGLLYRFVEDSRETA